VGTIAWARQNFTLCVRSKAPKQLKPKLLLSVEMAFALLKQSFWIKGSQAGAWEPAK